MQPRFLAAARLDRDAALDETLQFGEQAILFLNRRGYSTFILCKSCGQAVRCRDCSVTLTYHRGADQLVCHYCGYRTGPPGRCPSCAATGVERLGFGTEQVEAAVRERFPSAPAGAEQAIAEHACRKYSGRVGRSAAAKALDEEAVFLAVQAHVRHAHTDYDELLARYGDRALARHEVRARIEELLDAWSARP